MMTVRLSRREAADLFDDGAAAFDPVARRAEERPSSPGVDASVQKANPSGCVHPLRPSP